MKILVPIKQILDPSGITFRRDKERMFINREEYIIEAGSKAAIEAALRLKDEASDKQELSVVAVSVSPPRADDALREALALGCDAAYLLCDEAFDHADIAAVVRILATAVEQIGDVDLIIAGALASDTGAGQVGPRLAGALGYAQITGALTLELDGQACRAIRPWGDGHAAFAAALPAVVTVMPRAFPLRYAHGARIMNAYRQWEITTWDAGQLGLEPVTLEPLLDLRSESFPPEIPSGERYSGDPESVAQDAVMTLKLQRLIG
ncbi:MAG: electron transfer flavoprotein subunit beta [Anaerolineae bacterium]|jgi:electron transfer flavoprotein beta subunit